MSKVIVGNLALSRLGQSGTIENLETPKKPAELTVAKWIDHANRMAIQSLKPNFARKRVNISRSKQTVDFPNDYYLYPYPADCLEVLGIGNIEDKRNDFIVEGDFILTEYGEGGALPVRYVREVTNYSIMPASYIEALSWFLASCINMEITKDLNKQQFIEQKVMQTKREASALNAMENRPIRISRSKMTAIKRGGVFGVSKK